MVAQEVWISEINWTHGNVLSIIDNYRRGEAWLATWPRAMVAWSQYWSVWLPSWRSRSHNLGAITISLHLDTTLSSFLLFHSSQCDEFQFITSFYLFQMSCNLVYLECMQRFFSLRLHACYLHTIYFRSCTNEWSKLSLVVFTEGDNEREMKPLKCSISENIEATQWRAQFSAGMKVTQVK